MKIMEMLKQMLKKKQNLKIDAGKSFTTHIYNRLHVMNKNWLAVFCGETGSGKSYAAISFADITTNKQITVEDNVVIGDPLDFLNKLEEIIKNKDEYKGKFIIFDEAGVGMSSRDWYTVQNKVMAAVLQTFRNLNIGVIFTVPNLSYIDVSARKLFHHYLEPVSIDFKRNITSVRVYRLVYSNRGNQGRGKLYIKKPILLDKDGCTRKINTLEIPIPRKSLIDAYEIKKEKFVMKLIEEGKDMVTQLKLFEQEKYQPNKMKEEVLNHIRANYKDYLNIGGRGKGIDAKLIIAKHNISFHLAYGIKAMIDREKGLIANPSLT